MNFNFDNNEYCSLLFSFVYLMMDFGVENEMYEYC